MSKYLYQTVYEQFTGEKPPEPEAKEERTSRRGHGHPYRMRHNMRMQQQETAQNSDTKITRHPNAGQAHSSYNRDEMSITEIAKIEARHNIATTKITYKKTRHVPEMAQYA